MTSLVNTNDLPLMSMRISDPIKPTMNRRHQLTGGTVGMPGSLLDCWFSHHHRVVARKEYEPVYLR
jgi:hypothetical protein